MSITVAGMNATSHYLFNGAIQTLAGAWAGSELLTPSPVGVLWGMSNVSAGAIFGATYYMVTVLVSKGMAQILPLNDPKTTEMTQVVVILATSLLAMVGGFFALQAIGITLTAPVVIRLTLYSFLNSFIMNLAVRCFCGDIDNPSANQPVAATIV
jgi:hypothetical protein